MSSSGSLSLGAKMFVVVYMLATMALVYYVYINQREVVRKANYVLNEVIDRFASDEVLSERKQMKFHHAIIMEDFEYLKSVCVSSRTADESSSVSKDGAIHYKYYDPVTQKIVCDLEQEAKEFTPLMSSYYSKKIKVAELLLEFGANPNHGNQNHTLLMLAADRNETDWVELFLKYKADPNTPEPESGYSPLMLATYNNHLEVAFFLLQHGANIDHQVPKNGLTALMLAAANGHENMLKLLLASGADSFLEDQKQRTAMEVAKVHGNHKLELILIAHMSRFANEKEIPNIQFPHTEEL